MKQHRRIIQSVHSQNEYSWMSADSQFIKAEEFSYLTFNSCVNYELLEAINSQERYTVVLVGFCRFALTDNFAERVEALYLCTVF